MDEDQAHAVRQLLLGGEVAALGTLHNGEPAVSMVPYALMPGTGHFVIHVSRLATHTRDMQSHAGVSIMVVAERSQDSSAQALARVSFAATAAPCTAESPDYQAARAVYLARFPTAEPMFGFGDFSLYLLSPRAVRFVGGFAQAWSATGAQYQQAMALTQ
jgi:putative heme iron utilization protein